MPTTKQENGEKNAPKKGEKQVHAGILVKLGIGAAKQTKASRIQQLVTRCQAGEAAAFRELYDQHVAGVHRHLRLLIGPVPELDDLVQLVFLNVFQSIGSFRGQSAFSTWLFRITVNIARQEIRVKGRRRRLDGAVLEVGKITSQVAESTPEGELASQEHIYEILDVLPIKKREAFILFTYEGYSLEEIAELLGSTVSTIGSRLQSARKEILRVMACRKSM
jgi:RNA polymerase sigma-70 factor (ECF subfamily)